jgi:DNA-directed RNA polymerase specialized sigma24 family protein
MGGPNEAFLSTEWSAIERIATGAETDSQPLINNLLSKYWKPVYCYLRRKGYGNEEAKDLTQGFFHEVVLGRKLFQRASQAKGSFRKFLLTALTRYLTSIHRKQTAQKRIPRTKLAAIERIDVAELSEPIDGLTAEESFNNAWAATVLDTALAEVEAYCQAHELALHWNLFCDRVLEPITQDTDPPSLAGLCRAYGVEDVKKASNMIITVNRRLQATLCRHLRQTLSQETTVEEETDEIMRFLRKAAQRDG